MPSQFHFGKKDAFPIEGNRDENIEDVVIRIADAVLNGDIENNLVNEAVDTLQHYNNAVADLGAAKAELHGMKERMEGLEKSHADATATLATEHKVRSQPQS